MDKSIEQKIQVLTQKAKEEKAAENSRKQQIDSNIPNSLAEHIKTPEQAKTFMLLLNSLQK